jgi:hypothetical protein
MGSEPRKVVNTPVATPQSQVYFSADELTTGMIWLKISYDPRRNKYAHKLQDFIGLADWPGGLQFAAGESASSQFVSQ